MLYCTKSEEEEDMSSEPFWFVLLSIDRPTNRDQELLRKTFFHLQKQRIVMSWSHTYEFGGEKHFLIAQCMPEDAEKLKIEATEFFQAEYHALIKQKGEEGETL